MDILTMTEMAEILRGKMYSKWPWYIFCGCDMNVSLHIPVAKL